MTNRILQKSRARSRNEARELLQFFFASELISPSRTLWIVSPWLRNIDLFEGTARTFADLFPDASKPTVRLTDVLRALLVRGTRIVMALRSPRDDGGVGIELADIAASIDRSSALRIFDSATLHAKGLLGDHAAITGSMNVTHAGIESHTELLQFVTDSDHLARLRLEFSGEYGR